jgi:hypothetical protein
MGLVNDDGSAIKAVSVEVLKGLVCIGGCHFDKRKTVADKVYGKDSANFFEQILYGCRLRALRQVPNQ